MKNRSPFKLIKKKKKVSATPAGPALKRFLLCRPSFYGVCYKINPWMRLAIPVDRNMAVSQWDNLRDRIIEHGGEVNLVKPREGLPDMVFTANAGLVPPGKKMFILSNFRFEERKREEWWFRQHMVDLTVPVFVTGNLFEGAGDALVYDDFLVGGYGFRSDAAVYAELAPLYEKSIITMRLIDSRFYHLDTCFCPLEGKDYMIFPDAFGQEDLGRLRAHGGTEIAVPCKEAERFACNAVLIGRTVIMPSGCPETLQKLESRGYNVVPVEMSEFLKSGGACKCLTLDITGL